MSAEHPPLPPAASRALTTLQAHGWKVHVWQTTGMATLPSGEYGSAAFALLFAVRADRRLDATWVIERANVFSKDWTPASTVGRWKQQRGYLLTERGDCDPLTFASTLLNSDTQGLGEQTRVPARRLAEVIA